MAPEGKPLFQTMTGENCAARNIHKLNDSPHTPRGLVSHNKWPYAGFREGQQHRAFRIPPSRTLCKQVSGGNKCSAIVAEPWVAEWRDCGIRDRGKAFPWHVQVSFQI